MTVADLQKYIRGLADAIGAATKNPAKELLDVAERLAPFAQHEFTAFAEFLKLAEEYRSTGKLPEPGKKPTKQRAAKAPAAPKPPKAVPADVVALVAALQTRTLTDPALTREAVEAEVKGYEKRLSGAQWHEVTKALGYTQKPKNISEAIKTAVGHVFARRAGLERSDA
ncbi:unnamed protein product [Gemmataceae bacterium]|nr:unnamed protein product [Gemmataceae bacterium]VTT97941.1 unnamed protein product [Gemmataceae bacterium]